MSVYNINISISALDEERFGIRVARAFDVRQDDLVNVQGFCEDNRVDLVIAKCPCSDINTVHAMEQDGFCFMDTLIYYSKATSEKLPVVSGTIRPFIQEDVDTLKKIAHSAFRGYLNNYQADQRLDRTACDEVYPSWTEHSCMSSDMADEVLVVEKDCSIAGFLTLKVQGDEVCGPLLCVAPRFQSMSLSRSLMVAGIHWGRSRGAKHMIMSAQITNKHSHKVLTGLGFQIDYACYTLHKWFDR